MTKYLFLLVAVVVGGGIILWLVSRGPEPGLPLVPSPSPSPSPQYPPRVPSRLTAEAFPPDGVLLEWSDDSADEAGFVVSHSDDGVRFVDIATVAADITMLQIARLAPASQHYYRVRAVNAAGSSEHSNVVRVEIPVARSSPSPFPSPTSSPSPSVSPRPSPSPTLRPSPSLSPSPSVSPPPSNLPDFILESPAVLPVNPVAGASMEFTGNVRNRGGREASASRARLRIDLGNNGSWDLTPATVSLAALAPQGSVRVAWPAAWTAGTGTHRFEICADSAGAIAESDEGNNCAGQTFIVAVSPIPLPDQPTNLAASAVSSSEISLVWLDNASNETAYLLERGMDGTSFSVIAPNLPPNMTSHADQNLAPNTRYYYRVKAVNSAGSSSYSNIANTTTHVSQAAPDPPTNLRFTSFNHNEIQLAWNDASSNETGFRIERGTDNANFPESWTVAANVTAFTDRSVATVTTYYYRVRAYNALGNSSPVGPLAQRTSYERGFVRAQGEDLYLNGRKWYPHAVNYFPSFYTEGNTPGQQWLLNSYRNAANIAQVDRELAKLHDLGFNMVTIQGIRSASAANCANLNDFLNQAKEYNLRVGIFMLNSDPIGQLFWGRNLQTDLDIIRTCGLASNDIIFGYETDWEPALEGVGSELNQPYTARRRNDSRVAGRWRRWVEQNYGNIAAAYQNWGFTPSNPFPSQEDATCVSHDIPRRALAGYTYTFHLTMKNVGSVPWNGNAYQLWPFGQPLPRPVNAGETATFTFDYPIPPNAAPPFNVPWRMTKDGQPFGDQCETTSEFVTEDPTFPVPLITFEQSERLFTPTDAQLCIADQNVSSRKYTVAFLHFVNEFIGEEYRRVTNLYRGADPSHILYPHMGSNSLDWEFSCQWILYNKRWSVAKYFDVISEEIYIVYENLARNGFDSAVREHGFLAGYDDIGKPIYVNEVGLSSNCDESRRGLPQGFCSEGTKRTFLDKIYDLIMTTPFKGAGIWWFTGRQLDPHYNLYNNYGIVEPNTLDDYPAAVLIRSRSPELTSERTVPVANTTLTVDPDAYPNFQQFYAEGGDRYLALSNANGRRHVPVATTCSNRTSANVELSCVGNAPNVNSSGGRCPLKCLRAHFSPLKIKDRNGAWVTVKHGDTVSVAANTPLEAESMIENIRETEWLAGGSGRVRIVAEVNEEGASSALSRVDVQISRNVAGLSDYDAGRFTFSQGVSARARATFSLEAVGRSRFGEWIEVNLVP